MKIVIVGYGEMFQALISGVLKTKHEIVGVFRQENILYSSAKKFIYDVFKPSNDFNFIRNLGLYDIKAKSVNSPEFRDELKRLKVDVVLVGSWSEKFDTQTINIPKRACINAHPSLLPKYRGPNPYFHVLINQEKYSGITFHLMDVNYDTGAILHQAQTDVYPHDTGKSLKLRVCDLAKNEVKVLLHKFPEKIKKSISQNEKDATYQHRLQLRECILDFEKENVEQIERRMRALTPWVNCVIPYENQFFTFSKYKVCTKSAKDKQPGQIVKITDDALFIVCADKKVIEFSGLAIKAPFSSIITKFYLKKVIKLNSKAI